MEQTTTTTTAVAGVAAAKNPFVCVWEIVLETRRE
jgi:hypothetical protein